MRAAYEVVDDLDVVAMDQFQRLFFERRQTEWEHYLRDNANSVKQGQLTDPRYFDFISFAQLLTITDVFSDPRTAYVEAFNAQGGTRVVRRDGSVMPTSADILAKFSDKLGGRLLEKILETDRRDMPAFGAGQVLDMEQIVAGVNRIAVYFYLRGYCLTEPSVREEGGVISVVMVGPAVLWSTQALAQLHAVPNEYDVMATVAFLKAAGWCVVDGVATTATGNSLRRRFKVAKLGGGPM
jgi:hypothetical protein